MTTPKPTVTGAIPELMEANQMASVMERLARTQKDKLILIGPDADPENLDEMASFLQHCAETRDLAAWNARFPGQIIEGGPVVAIIPHNVVEHLRSLPPPSLEDATLDRVMQDCELLAQAPPEPTDDEIRVAIQQVNSISERTLPLADDRLTAMLDGRWDRTWDRAWEPSRKYPPLEFSPPQAPPEKRSAHPKAGRDIDPSARKKRNRHQKQQRRKNRA